MPHHHPPPFTAVLFGLSGCLVDFGARTLPVALNRLLPNCSTARLDEANTLPPESALAHVADAPVAAVQREAFEQYLQQAAREHAETITDLERLARLKELQGVPCAWLDELPPQASSNLAIPLPAWLLGGSQAQGRPWPAPDHCWQVLSKLGVDHLAGCVVVAGSPRLLQSGLNAGLWTIGLATSGGLCGHAPADWRALDSQERERLRAAATLELYRLGAHSVIDHLGELGPCLADLAVRRQKGEKP